MRFYRINWHKRLPAVRVPVPTVGTLEAVLTIESEEYGGPDEGARLLNLLLYRRTPRDWLASWLFLLFGGPSAYSLLIENVFDTDRFFSELGKKPRKSARRSKHPTPEKNLRELRAEIARLAVEQKVTPAEIRALELPDFYRIQASLDEAKLNQRKWEASLNGRKIR
ncbi:MAG: hypothetical protein AAGJ81_14750 [Verrucomicrobiota bacterium]